MTNAEGFVQVIETLEKMSRMFQQDLLSNLGIKENWPEILENVKVCPIKVIQFGGSRKFSPSKHLALIPTLPKINPSKERF